MFTAGLVAILMACPAWIVDRAIDPVKGIPAHSTFMPSLSDVRAWCQGFIDDDYRHRELMGRFDRPQLPAPPRPPRPSYDELKARYGENFGLHPDGAKPAPPTREQARAALRAEFGDAALDGIPDQPSSFRRVKS